jgi:quinol-cytochrome oxidoreductase complex cytochrome b subunit
LGGISVLLFLVLVATGVLLLLSYEATPEGAYASVRSLEGEVPFGSFVRAVHHWGANALIVIVFLHLLRVFFTGAFHPPRRFNWVLGLVLLLLVTASNFTGYLLPWDQLAFWAVTIATGMLEYVPLAGLPLQEAIRGGEEVGAETLSIFFVLHVAILPIVLFILTSFHFWLVRKGGGVMLPRAEGEDAPKKTPIPVRPNLVYREGVAALVVMALLFLASALFAAPLQEQANAGMSPNPAKAPWYFMGIQELLVHLHPSFAVFVVPLLAAVLLVVLPYLKFGEAPTGLWFHSERGRRAAMAAAVAALVISPLYVVAGEKLLEWQKLFPSLPPVVSNGLFPTILIGALVVGVGWVLRMTYRSTRLETVQTIFTFLIVAFLVFTIVGIFFRGEGMRLVWIW